MILSILPMIPVALHPCRGAAEWAYVGLEILIGSPVRRTLATFRGPFGAVTANLRPSPPLRAGKAQPLEGGSGAGGRQVGLSRGPGTKSLVRRDLEESSVICKVRSELLRPLLSLLDLVKHLGYVFSEYGKSRG